MEEQKMMEASRLESNFIFKSTIKVPDQIRILLLSRLFLQFHFLFNFTNLIDLMNFGSRSSLALFTWLNSLIIPICFSEVWPLEITSLFLTGISLAICLSHSIGFSWSIFFQSIQWYGSRCDPCSFLTSPTWNRSAIWDLQFSIWFNDSSLKRP